MAVGAPSMKYADLVREVRDDWLAARETKAALEARREHDYKLYRRFRDDVVGAGGGVHGFHEAVTGPFGWSKLTVPIVFWIVETIVPRVATTPPTLVVSPDTPEATPYAQAKEVEMQGTLEAMGVRMTMHRALKRMVLYGDGPTKVTWDAAHRRPRFTDISWFDWFLSPDARLPETAEVQFHRTWYTRRQLQRLSKLTDRNGAPLFYGLEHITGTETQESADPTLAARLDASGMGTRQWSAEGGLFCLVECWYQDGTVVVLGGNEGDSIVQIRTSPYRDEDGQPIRPFVVFPNSHDPESPWSIGDAEMLEDHQHEVSTLRNQAIDQTTVNLSAPVIYSGNVSGQEIDAAFGQPGGKLRVTGDVRSSVMRMPPGQVSADFSGWYGNIRDESQLIAGVSDAQAGQVDTLQRSATEVSIVNQEANRRWQLKIAVTEDRFAQVGRLIDLAERRYGIPGKAITVPKGISIMEGQQGLLGPDGQPLPPGATASRQFARTSAMVNSPQARYSVKVRGGSLTMPSELEEFRKTMTLVEALLAIPPAQQQINWREIISMVVSSSGFDPDRLMISEEELAQQEMNVALEQMMAAQGGVPAPGGAPAAPAPTAA